MKFARMSICALLVFASACGESTEHVAAPAATVQPGQSIQAAVDAAAPGDTVTVAPGDYTEPQTGLNALHITKSIKLIAQSTPNAPVRLLPGPGQHDGILVEPANDGDPDIDGLEINGFTVQGFSNNGIWLRHVNNFTIENNTTIGNLENGIWPTLSANGLVTKNVSYGSQDSALWVEASTNVRVIDNEFHHSPTGLEITVSHEITVENNQVHDNTIGIGLYHPAAAGLPPLMPLSDNGYWHILNNHVYDNNLPNPVSGGSLVAQIPQGGGILLLGVDHVDVKDNQVDDNDFFGVAMIDYCQATSGTDFDCHTNPPEVSDTAPDYNQFVSNDFTHNGTNPPAGPFQSIAADLVALSGANAVGNCASNNNAATFVELPELPTCS